jgi:hypothetical protein
MDKRERCRYRMCYRWIRRTLQESIFLSSFQGEIASAQTGRRTTICTAHRTRKRGKVIKIQEVQEQLGEVNLEAFERVFCVAI